MQNFLEKDFEGNKIHILKYNNKPCLIANELLKIFGYSNPSKTIQYYLKFEEFQTDIEYEVLKKDDLKLFIKNTNSIYPNLINHKTRNLLVLYEKGLYGLLQHSSKKIGIKFRNWLRREILPFLELSYDKSISNNFMNNNALFGNTKLENNLNSNNLSINDKINIFNTAINSLNSIYLFLDEDLSIEDKKNIVSTIFSYIDINLFFK